MESIKLNFSEVSQIVEQSILTKANILSTAMNEICFINKNQFYMFNSSTSSWDALSLINKRILNIALTILDTSYKSLSDSERVTLFKSSKKIEKFNQINQNCISLIRIKTILDNIMFNNTHQQIHFRNGYMDMSDGQFKQGTNKIYITNFIERDYQVAKEKGIIQVNKLISQIYPDKQDRETMIKYLSICLSWEAPQLQSSLFLLGKGSSGKSTILQLMEKCLGCYVKSLNSSTFSNPQNINKAMNTYSDSSNILLTYINEVSNKKMDTSIFKEFVEGKCNTIKLYKEGSHSFNYNSMIILMGNLIPNFLCDSGMGRRIQGYMHSSSFVDDNVNEKKHIYKKTRI